MYLLLCLSCLHSFSFVEPSHIFIHFVPRCSATRLLELCQVFWPVTEWKGRRQLLQHSGPEKLAERRREGAGKWREGWRDGGEGREGGGGCFLCHCGPILSPENVTLPLGGSAPRRDSSVWPHLPRCSVARSRGAWEASHCTLSAHQHPSHWLFPTKPTMDLIFQPQNSVYFGKQSRILIYISHTQQQQQQRTLDVNLLGKR